MAAAVMRRQAVDYYTIELSHLADGTMFVTMTGTGIDEYEPQLLTQEITSERVASLDAALVVIKQGLSANIIGR